MNRTTRICNVLLPVLAAATITAAKAARPFTTDDAGALDNGRCELEAVHGGERARGGPTSRASVLQGACGVVAGTQLGLAWQRASASGEHEDSLALAGKSVLDLGAGPALALAYGADLLRGADGQSTRLSSVTLGLLASLPAGEFGTWHANLGWQHDRLQRQTRMSWALLLEKTLSPALDGGVETYGDDRAAAWLGLGLRWTLRPGLSLNAAAAQQLDSQRTRAASVGVKFDF